MPASKRPSTSSLRRYLTSRPYIAVADIRRRFGLDPDAMSRVSRNGTTAYIGLPDREASKVEELWRRDEVELQLSVEVHAPVVVGVYPMRLARFVMEQQGNGFGHHAPQVAPHSGPQNGRGVQNGHRAATNGIDRGSPVPADPEPTTGAARPSAEPVRHGGDVAEA